MHHCSFPFCTLDSRVLSLCFLSTITLFLHCIVSSIDWGNVYKDSVHPLVKQGKMYSSKFSSVQSSQAQWYKLTWFYLSINKEKEEFLSSFLIDNLFPSVFSSIGTMHNYLLSIQSLPIHITTLYPFHFPYPSISSANAL